MTLLFQRSKTVLLKKSMKQLPLLKIAHLRRSKITKSSKFRAFCKTLDLSKISRKRRKLKLLLNILK